MGLIRTQLTQLLGKGLDGSALAQTVHSNNVANENTPGFKKSEVYFKHTLEAFLQDDDPLLLKTRAAHMPLGPYTEEADRLRGTRAGHYPLYETPASADSMKKTGSRHLGLVTGADGPRVVYNMETYALRSDGNNVDVDMEQAAIAENEIYYDTLLQLLSEQYGLLRTAVSEGRR
jgi:flagellar basal-body rod protein FlgB